MISEHRLSTLVGQVNSVQYQLCSKRELARELVSTTDEYNRLALEPAASVSEAAQSADTAAMVSRLGEGEQQRLAEEIVSLEQEKERLLSRLYEEGMETGRWIGVSDRYVQLSGAEGDSKEDSKEFSKADPDENSGSDLSLHVIPKGYERYMLGDEAPEVTARRVSYATGHRRRSKELTGILLMVMLAGLVYSLDLLPLWLTWASFAAIVAASAFVLPGGWTLAWWIIGPSQTPDSPWLEVMPDSGERFENSASPSAEPSGADEHRRVRAYAQIEAARKEKKKRGGKL